MKIILLGKQSLYLKNLNLIEPLLYYTHPMKVLIIEDDAQLNIALCEFFKIKVFETVSVKNGLQAMHYLDSEYFDLYIIDINIPEINGLELLRYIRKVDINTPIIIITASPEIENLTDAFENGCNEYIKKPFHLKELDVRISNLLPNQVNTTISLTKELHYDLKLEELIYNDIQIPLRYKEKKFCKLLIKNINTYVPLENIYHYVWEGEIKESYPLRQLVAELRKKLPFEIIVSKIKVGYMINTIT